MRLFRRLVEALGILLTLAALTLLFTFGEYILYFMLLAAALVLNTRFKIGVYRIVVATSFLWLLKELCDIYNNELFELSLRYDIVVNPPYIDESLFLLLGGLHMALGYLVLKKFEL